MEDMVAGQNFIKGEFIMSVPPFDVASYYESKKEEKLKIFFLSEGQKSERYFYKYLFEDESYGFIKPDGVILKEIKKLGSDEGLSNGLKLVKRAIIWCNDDENHFDKNKDKVVVTFDLDTLTNEDIEELKTIREPYILYAFSNPKFEIVQLLALMEDLSLIESKYRKCSFPNKVLENEFSSFSHANSKTNKSGKFVASRYVELIKHRKYDEDDISKAKDKFCTNVLNVLDYILKLNT